MDLRKRFELLFTVIVVAGTVGMIGVRMGIRARKQALEKQLSAAVSRDDALSVITLLDRGVTPRKGRRGPSSLVAMACSAGAKRTLVALLYRGEHPGDNDICIPALRNDNEMVDILMQAGANPNGRAYGIFPLVISLAESRQTEMMKKMLRYGANPNVIYPIKGHWPLGYTPLMISASSKDMVGARALLNAGARVNVSVVDPSSDQLGYTALMIAEKHKATDQVALLLKFGAKTDTVARDGASPMALAKQNKAMLKLIEKYSSSTKHRIEVSL